MSYLMTIQNDVQKFAKVIHDVLQVDVTIVDDGFKRVAGTGRFKETIGCTIDISTVFARALERGESYFIDNPGKCSLCDMCRDKGVCIESAEVCCPIIFEGKPIGVIGLVAFEEVQKLELMTNREGLMEFLNQMADLISSRVLEGEMLTRNKLLRKQLEAIVDTIDEGIIAVNQFGEITHCSYFAKKILNVDNEEPQGRNIEDVFPELWKKVREAQGDNNREINMDSIKGSRVILAARSIIYDNSVKGTVIVLRSISDVRKIINHVSSNTISIYFKDIIGESDVINDVKDKALKASSGCSTVFITGESGTGKELFARAIHSEGCRRDKPFIAINCAAIPESLLESELFGYEDGAFTGAKKGGKIGKFELAKGGTIFLDEIGDMPIHLQTKLLRVLQEKTIERVGGVKDIPLDVRIITATHRDISRMLDNGEFRSDLFYRLNVIPISIPPLRDRRADIPLLMKHILKKCNMKLEKSVHDFTDEVYDVFINYDWPGNIRELENAIEYAVNMENSSKIKPGSLHQKFRYIPCCCVSVKEGTCTSLIIPIRELERSAIINALKSLDGDRESTAKALGIGRATLYRKLKEYGID